jgi:hypothetical protein
MNTVRRVEWFERDPGGTTIYVAPAASPDSELDVEEVGLEYCTVCDDLTEIAIRSGDQRDLLPLRGRCRVSDTPE